MIYTSLAVLAMSASAAISPLSNIIHFHPKATQPDTRVSVTLVNQARGFRDVNVGGHTYTVLSHQALEIKAPAGTLVYAGNPTPHFKRGDVVLEVAPQNDHTRVILD